MSVRPAISTRRSAFGSVSSSGTFPATGVIPSIFNSGERMASSRASASSTPGSVSMMTRKGPRLAESDPNISGVVEDAKALAIAAAPEEVTNCRRVTPNSFVDSMIALKVATPNRRTGTRLSNAARIILVFVRPSLSMRRSNVTSRRVAESACALVVATATLLAPCLLQAQCQPTTETAKTNMAATAGNSAAPPQFYDEPQFAVAGVTDTTNLGGHGSDTAIRTKDALAKDTVALSDDARPDAAADRSPKGLPTWNGRRNNIPGGLRRRTCPDGRVYRRAPIHRREADAGPRACP